MSNAVPSFRRSGNLGLLRKEQIFALALALAMTSAWAQSRPVWAQLTSDQQAVLRPLQPRWDSLPELQRVRLRDAANRYATLSMEQQRRFSQRLTQWASLTLEQRNQARDLYRQFAHMPKAEQERIRERWFAEHPGTEVATARAAGQTAIPRPTDSGH